MYSLIQTNNIEFKKSKLQKELFGLLLIFQLDDSISKLNLNSKLESDEFPLLNYLIWKWRIESGFQWLP
jgi:hypothetical protein